MSKAALYSALGNTMQTGAARMFQEQDRKAAERRQDSLLELRRQWQVEDRDFSADAAMDRAIKTSTLSHQHALERQTAQNESPATMAMIDARQASAEASRARADLYGRQAEQVGQTPAGGLGIDSMTDIFGSVDPALATPEFMGELRRGNFDPTLLKKEPQGKDETDRVLTRSMREQAAEMIPTETQYGGAIRNPVERFIESMPRDAEQAGVTPEDSVTDARNKLSELMIGQIYESSSSGDSEPVPKYTEQEMGQIAGAATEALRNGKTTETVLNSLLANGVPRDIAYAIVRGEY